MPQSLARILVHLIFSTKNPEPFLRDDVRPELHKYISAAAGQGRSIGSQVSRSCNCARRVL